MLAGRLALVVEQRLLDSQPRGADFNYLQLVYGVHSRFDSANPRTGIPALQQRREQDINRKSMAYDIEDATAPSGEGGQIREPEVLDISSTGI